MGDPGVGRSGESDVIRDLRVPETLRVQRTARHQAHAPGARGRQGRGVGREVGSPWRSTSRSCMRRVSGPRCSRIAEARYLACGSGSVWTPLRAPGLGPPSPRTRRRCCRAWSTRLMDMLVDREELFAHRRTRRTYGDAHRSLESAGRRHDGATASGLLPAAARPSGRLANRRESQQCAAQPARARDHRRQTPCGATAVGHAASRVAAGSRSPRTTRTAGRRASTTFDLPWAPCSRSDPEGPRPPARRASDGRAPRRVSVADGAAGVPGARVDGQAVAEVLTRGSITDVSGILVGQPPPSRFRRDAWRWLGLRDHRRPDCRRAPRAPSTSEGARPASQGDRSPRPREQRALHRRRGADGRERLRSRRGRRCHAVARAARPRPGDGRRARPHRARRGDLRPAGGRLAELRPTAEFGFAAANAAGIDVPVGNVGAGVGARAGVLKGGIGTASVTLHDIGVTVGADRRGECGGQRRRSGDGTAVDERRSSPSSGCSAPARRGDRSVRRARCRTVAAEHHHRRRRH